MRRTFAILAIASIASAHAASRQVMTFDGVGAVRLGMSVAEIAQALGSPLDPVDKLVFSDECFVTERADKSDPGIQYTITNGRLRRIDVWQPTGAAAPEVTTAEGIGMSSTPVDVRRTYGQKIAVTPAPYYDEEGCDAAAAGYNTGQLRDGTPAHCSMHFDADDHRRGIIFETEGNRVTALQIGLIDELKELEICQ